MSTYDLMPCEKPAHPACNVAHERLGLEARMIRGLIRGLKREGFEAVAVDDGGDEVVTVQGEKQTMDAVFAVDESMIYFTASGGRRRWVQVVLGNGVDCLPDYGMARTEDDGWNAAMGRITDELYEKHS